MTDPLRDMIRERIPRFIPPNPQSWFNLGSLGGIQPAGGGHALYLHSSDGFRKVDPILLSIEEAWMLGEALLVYALAVEQSATPSGAGGATE